MRRISSKVTRINVEIFDSRIAHSVTDTRGEFGGVMLEACTNGSRTTSWKILIA